MHFPSPIRKRLLHGALLACASVFAVLLLRRPSTPTTPRHRLRFPLSSPLNTTTLVDLHDFHFTLVDDNVCGSSQSSVYLAMFVHSTPSHFDERAALRETWAGVRSVQGRTVRAVFLVGHAVSDELVAEKLREESDTFGDLVQGNFVDSYANLTYKHAMGLRWVSERCTQTRFVLKVDEDAFVDTFQLVDFLLTVYGVAGASRTLLCHLFPRGTPVQRNGKWKVEADQVPYSMYPPYCAGLAYIVTPDLALELLAAAAVVPFFWIDDVFVTGMLAEMLHVRHQKLNLRTALRERPVRDWLSDDRRSLQQSPFLVASLGDFKRWTQVLRTLWKKTCLAHNHTQVINENAV